MFADILVLWLFGVPAAVVATTELGCRLTERRRVGAIQTSTKTHPFTLLLVDLRSPSVHDRPFGGRTRSRRPECLNRTIGLRKP
jgi:hypothetical protein